ncbi:MAG: FecR family protein [Verrucomicrobiota bacterium]
MNPDPTDTAIEAAAATWLARRDRGFTAAEQDEFLQWLREDPRHRACFAQLDSAWAEFDALTQWRPEHSTRPNPDLLARPAVPRAPWRLPLALAAAAAVLAAGWFARQPPPAPAPRGLPSQASALRDYDQKILEDGSIIDLNRGGSVEVRYTAAERRVWLTAGEAHFTVAKNPHRPFIVRAGKVDVRAVGTAFNIRLDPAAVEVLVTEGRVQVTPPASGPALPVLHAGQRVVLPAAGPAAVDTVSADEMSRLMAWQPRQLEFDSARLADVVAAFNRHNRVQLELGDPALADLAIGASFRSNNVEGFVRLLESGFEIAAERRGDRIVLRPAR